MKVVGLFLLVCNLTMASVPKGVNWHEGTVEKAFSLAKERNRPLFLYWGAVWCPPCNHIKKKVFSSPEFQKEIKNFIAIYLDGDTDRAQIWGEKLKASGYPTMLVMNSNGQEVMRLPTTIDAKKYTELLRSSLKSEVSIKELAKKKVLTDAQWSQLAFYSWGQNKEIKNKGELFKDLYLRVPLELKEEKASLLIKYLSFLTDDKKASFDKPMLRTNFINLLKNEKLVKNVSGDLSYSGEKFIDLLFDKEKVKYQKILIDLLDKLSKNKSLSLEERLFSLAYEMKLALKDEKKLENFQKKLLEKVRETDKAANDHYSRQDAMSTAVWMLMEAKLLKEAKAYATDELKKSLAPYYFMSYLASIEKEEGRIENYIDWKYKAWKSSKGGSTRFQWGTSYLSSLIENNKKKSFSRDMKIILNELLKQPDAFNGRNKKRLERLHKSLTKIEDKTFNLRVKAIVIEECSKLKKSKECHNEFKELGFM